MKKEHVKKPIKDLKSAKQKAGYIVCKTMNILLCIYLLILSKLNAPRKIIILSIVLIIIQYLMDLLLQVYYSSQSEDL